MDRQLIELYAHGGEKLSRSIGGLTQEDLFATPGPGKWSMQQVVLHLLDAEAAFADRIKRVIAMDNPTLLSWDENKFLDKLHYNEQPVEDAVKLLDLTRRHVANILRKLPDDAFNRTGQHNERGPQTVLDILKSAINHMEHHLEFINKKRENLGKLMW